jgi:hypothetical protein
VKFYVTFGHAHSDPPGELMHSFMLVYAPDESTAKEKVVRAIGKRWAFIYDEPRFVGQIEKYDLTLWRVLR